MGTIAEPCYFEELGLHTDNLIEAACNLTKEQLEEYKETFRQFDVDGDGSISAEELGAVMKKLGQKMSKEELQQMIDEVDEDKNGAIDFDEFVNLMARSAQNMDSETCLRQTFEMFDKDGNGTISASELLNAMNVMGVELNSDEAEQMIKEADMNGDGEISYDEFVTMMSGLSGDAQE